MENNDKVKMTHNKETGTFNSNGIYSSNYSLLWSMKYNREQLRKMWKKEKSKLPFKKWVNKRDKEELDKDQKTY